MKIIDNQTNTSFCKTKIRSYNLRYKHIKCIIDKTRYICIFHEITYVFYKSTK